MATGRRPEHHATRGRQGLYPVLGVCKEGGGGDNGAVAMRLETDPEPETVPVAPGS